MFFKADLLNGDGVYAGLVKVASGDEWKVIFDGAQLPFSASAFECNDRLSLTREGELPHFMDPASA